MLMTREQAIEWVGEKAIVMAESAHIGYWYGKTAMAYFYLDEHAISVIYCRDKKTTYEIHEIQGSPINKKVPKC